MATDTPQTGPNERTVVPGRRLGRLPFRSRLKALQFSDFFKFVELPTKTGYWTKKVPLEKRTFGNDDFGCCTRAKQAYAAIRMERIEQKRTINITDEEVVRVYREMCIREYGSDEDNGAYEDDALSAWRNPEHTFKDTAGHPLTIDAYLAINAKNIPEVKAGLALSGAHGMAVCFNLPYAWKDVDDWAVPEDHPLTGPFMPGTWGGHSMHAIDYDAQWMYVDDTWAFGVRRVSWPAVAAYMDEAHLIIDSVNTWKKKAETTAGRFETSAAKVRQSLSRVVEAVNDVSSIKIA